MKRIIPATALALAACSGEPAADTKSNEVKAGELPAAVPAEPADLASEAVPAANATDDGNEAAEPGRGRPDRARPYQPLPEDTSPPPRLPIDDEAGREINTMPH